MRITGYDAHGRVHAAARDGDSLIPLGDIDEFWRDPHAHSERATKIDERIGIGSVVLRPPVPASARVMCVGLNYAEHIAEGPFDAPRYPTIFGRWTSSLAVSGTPVAVPVDEPGLDWESELLVAVGRPLSMAEPREVQSALFGYAAFNDITARRAQKLTTQWTIGKNVDASGPMSDLLTCDEVPSLRGRRVTARVNGETVQSAPTDQMIFTVAEIVAFISRTVPLRPGDLIATGTPSGVGYARNPPRFLHPGDVVEAGVEGIGTVRTPIVAWADRTAP